MTAPVRIALAGALGRMGRAVAALAAEQGGVVVTASFDRPGSLPSEGLVTQDEALGLCDVVVDFTTAAASTALAAQCARSGGPALVIGSTGFSEAEEAAIVQAAQSLAIVKAGNFGLGVNVLLGLVRQAAAALGPDAFDIEIFEAHHRRKRDAPSGTALMLGRAAAEGRGVALSAVRSPPPSASSGPRIEGGIGFSVMRGGGLVGEHAVSFLSEDEVLTLSHSARDRGLFARGALAAAVWAAGREPGLYDMQDVLGFTRAGAHG